MLALALPVALEPLLSTMLRSAARTRLRIWRNAVRLRSSLRTSSRSFAFFRPPPSVLVAMSVMAALNARRPARSSAVTMRLVTIWRSAIRASAARMWAMALVRSTRSSAGSAGSGSRQLYRCMMRQTLSPKAETDSRSPWRRVDQSIAMSAVEAMWQYRSWKATRNRGQPAMAAA